MAVPDLPAEQHRERVVVRGRHCSPQITIGKLSKSERPHSIVGSTSEQDLTASSGVADHSADRIRPRTSRAVEPAPGSMPLHSRNPRIDRCEEDVR
jgi:hypothetical protein